MSKAFTRDDGPDEPLVVPPRAPLPPGTPNYVTPRGLLLLKAEQIEMAAARSRLAAEDGDDPGVRRERTIAARRLEALSARVASAVVVDPKTQPQDEVRFGATVTLVTAEGEHAGEERQVQIVGVDEASPAERRVAFVAPIAKAILGLKVGETTTLRTARGDEVLEVRAIVYAAGQ